MCNDKIIKELLLAYREQALDKTEELMIENHLASCEDCRIELTLLRMLTEEAVPDPGEAYWSAMPGRVYRAVQEQKTGNTSFDLARLLERITLPRWTWAAASVMTVLLVSWLIIGPVQQEPALNPSQEYEFGAESIPSELVNISELNNEELSAIDNWAGAELAFIAGESEQVLENSQERDVYEELVELDAQQAERLLKMIDQRMKEVTT